MQEGVQVPIHIMNQPDFLTARVLALEDVEVYVEDLEFARVLCEETMAVKRESPMQVSNAGALPMRLHPHGVYYTSHVKFVTAFALLCLSP